jgi:hypothetical protein
MRIVAATFVPSTGRLDDSVQRDLLDDPDLSHFESLLLDVLPAILIMRVNAA